MEGVQEEIIIAALDDLEQGQTIEATLDRYPQQADELRPILEAAAGLSAAAPPPSAQARQASRQAFLAEAQRLRNAARPAHSPAPWRRFFYRLTALALFALFLGIVFIPPSADAIPGDLLYPVKRTVETVQLQLAAPAERDLLRAEFEKERNHEVYEMLDLGRNGQAGYIGVLKAVEPDAWQIGNITAHVTGETVIEGQPEVGARVEAHCLVQDGEVIAESLTVLEPAREIGPPSP